MNAPRAAAIFSALFVIPLVLGLGAFLLIPVALLLLPLLVIAGIAALPAAFATLSRAAPSAVAPAVVITG